MNLNEMNRRRCLSSPNDTVRLIYIDNREKNVTLSQVVEHMIKEAMEKTEAETEKEVNAKTKAEREVVSTTVETTTEKLKQGKFNFSFFI